MGKLKGIPVILIDKVKIGEDNLGAPIYEEAELVIDNVLVAPASTEDITNQINLTGRKISYTLAIPKGDKNNWEGRKVKFFGKTWKTVGIPTEGIESLIPLDWNRKVQVERFE